MLGGNVIIAMIRYVISVAGVILLFSQMSQFRFDRKKTVIGYALFTVVLVSGACVWYVLDFQGCAGLSSKMCKLIFRRSYDRHIYYLKLNQRVAPHHFYKPHIKVTYHALSGTGNR